MLQDRIKENKYRLIFLLNGYNKILHKLLANRLSSIIPGLLHPNQCGLLGTPDAAETLANVREYIHNVNVIQRTFALLRINTNQTFDRLNSNFLCDILRRYNFPTNFIQLITCIHRHRKLSIQVNQRNLKHINMTTWLEQGNPISSQHFSIQMNRAYKESSAMDTSLN